jgi:alkylhydroperoxidase family enzyme
MAVRMIAEQDAGALSGLYAEIRQRMGLGYVPNVFKAMAAVNTDVLRQNWAAFRYTVLEGELPREVKEMIGLVVASELGSAYVTQLHERALASLQMSPDVIDALLQTGDWSGLSPSVRLALQFARESAPNPARGDISVLEAAGFTEDEAHEVMDTVLIVSGLVSFVAESGVPLD